MPTIDQPVRAMAPRAGTRQPPRIGVRGGGGQEFRPRGLFERYGLADLDVRMGRFEGRNTALGYLGLQRPSHRLKKCFRGLRKAVVDADGRSSRPIAAGARHGKYRPHRPHHRNALILQRFLAGGIFTWYRQQTVCYRPPRHISPAYRVLNICAFCRSFSPVMLTAVGAVGIFLGLYLKVSNRSACILLPELT